MAIFGLFFTLFYSIFRGLFQLVAFILKAVGRILAFAVGTGQQKENRRI